MMTKEEKKEAFLQILENWFEDFSSDVNINNCIGFYKHLLLSLKFEYQVSITTDRNFFFKGVYDLLFDFDTKLEQEQIPIEEIIGKKALKNITPPASKNNTLYISELISVYYTAKEEFIFL